MLFTFLVCLENVRAIIKFSLWKVSVIPKKDFSGFNLVCLFFLPNHISYWLSAHILRQQKSQQRRVIFNFLPAWQHYIVFNLHGRAKMRTRIEFAFSCIYLAIPTHHWKTNAELRWLCRMRDDDKDWGEEMNLWYVRIQKEDCFSRNTKDQAIWQEKKSSKLNPT